MIRAFLRAAVLCALILSIVPHLAAGGNREESVEPPEADPAISDDSRSEPVEEPRPREITPQVDTPPTQTPDRSPTQHPQEPAPDIEAELRSEIETLRTRVDTLEQENAELTELLDEAQFMLSLYVPDRSVVRQLERGESQMDLVFEERDNVFAPPPTVERIERNGDRTLLIDLGDHSAITHPRYNRSTDATVLMEIERSRLETTATLLLQIVTPVSEEALYLESLQVSSGTERRYVDLSAVERITDSNYRLERALLPLDDRSIDILRLVLSQDSSVDFDGPRRSITKMIPAAEREALSDMLYLFRELGGTL